MHREKNRPVAGNALFLILIAVALFAILAYAVTQSGKGSGTSNKEKAALEASRIIQYIGDVQQAVTRIRTLNGCAETSISFDISATTSPCPLPLGSCIAYNYANPNAPSDKSCHVFDPAGGNVKYIAPDARWFGNGAYNLSYFKWGFSGNVRIFGLSSGNPELIMTLGDISNELCMAINKQLGIPNNGTQPPYEPYNATVFTGTYAADPGPLASDGWPHQIGDDNANFRGQTIGCSKGYGSTYNKLFSVLIAR